MHELDEAAWEQWVAYRKAIRKTIKPASEHAMKLKLSRFGADQQAVVDQSIAGQYQGLFELKKAMPRPGEKVEKTDQQKAADQRVLEQPVRPVHRIDRQSDEQYGEQDAQDGQVAAMSQGALASQ